MIEFTPYPWQIQFMQAIQRTSEQQRLPHGLLFSGPAGIGKKHLANCLAYQVLLQHAKPATIEPLLQSGTHPDVMVITPIEDKKQISVDQIRAFSARICLTPQLSQTKIGLIHPAETMTTAAANALLKTLEEPPGDALIMLISHNPGRLPQTIRSRCQQIPLGLPPVKDALHWLEDEGVNNPQEYLALTNGAPLAAKLAAQSSWLESHQNLMTDLSALIERRVGMVEISIKWRNTELPLLISWIQHLVFSLIKSRLKAEIQSNPVANLLKNLKISFDGIDLRTLIDYSDYLAKSAREVDNNLNQELFLEQLFTRWAALGST